MNALNRNAFSDRTLRAFSLLIPDDTRSAFR